MDQPPQEKGIVYLIHFERPFKHAQHYLGWATDVTERIKRHVSLARKRRGSALMRAVVEAGIAFKIVRLWGDKTRDEERRMHLWGSGTRLCPVCRGRIKYEDVK